MGVYADTSFLASYYLPDANSGLVPGVLRDVTSGIIFTALHRLELGNALVLAVFQQRIARDQADAVWKDVTDDLRAGLLKPASMPWYAILRRAAQLTKKHTFETGCRSLDLLHIAAALQLNRPKFFSFDLRQREVARRVGFLVVPSRL